MPDTQLDVGELLTPRAPNTTGRSSSFSALPRPSIAVGYTTPFSTLEFGYDWSRHRFQADVPRISQLLHSIFAKATLHAGYKAPVSVVFLVQVSRTTRTPLKPKHSRILSHCPHATQYSWSLCRRWELQLGVKTAGYSGIGHPMQLQTGRGVRNSPICYSYDKAGFLRPTEECHLSYL